MVESGLRWFDAWGGIILKGYKEASLNKVNDTIRTPLKIEGASTPAVDFYDSDTNIQCGAIYFSTADDKRRLTIKQYNADQDTASSKYAECYYLPSPTTGLTSDVWYQLISTENRYLIFPVGSCYITSTNTNPSSILGGGTWELIDKQFAQLRQSGNNVITYNSSNVESYDTAYAIRSGHTITIDLGWDFTSTSIDDSTIEVGTLNLSALGVSAITNGSSHILFSGDAPNGICLCSLSGAGVLALQDTVVADGADAMTVDGTVGGIFTLSFTMDHMLDSACNQFIWKRTA